MSYLTLHRSCLRSTKLVLVVCHFKPKSQSILALKHDLLLINHSRFTGSLGKWWQVMRANYAGAFYLPEHHPMPSMYIFHYESMIPHQVTKPNNCQCGRNKDAAKVDLCTFCKEYATVLELPKAPYLYSVNKGNFRAYYESYFRECFKTATCAVGK